MRDQPIANVEGLKYLGVQIDQNMTSDQHIDGICKKVPRAFPITSLTLDRGQFMNLCQFLLGS